MFWRIHCQHKVILNKRELRMVDGNIPTGWNAPGQEDNAEVTPWGFSSWGENCRSQLPKSSGMFPKIPGRLHPQDTAPLPSLSPFLAAPGIFSGFEVTVLGWLEGHRIFQGARPSCCHHSWSFGVTKSFWDRSTSSLSIPGWVSLFWEYFPNLQHSPRHQDLLGHQLSFTRRGERRPNPTPKGSPHSQVIPWAQTWNSLSIQLQTEIPTGYRHFPHSTN